ncbi:sulfotransferase family protein [Thiohalobacter sp.]|uniref:sulfotransferase family protein n=1 Tax=Thiohalobacter sp. TaxID=2025948 RepID=UPI00261CCD63|nr:sulfotransferase [Thiohalobacter sp.]
MTARPPIRPGFLVGEGRSGTTLLSSILNRHPRLCVTPETHFFRLLHAYPGGPRTFARDWPASLEWMTARMEPTPEWQPDAQRWLAALPGDGRRRYPGHARLFLLIGDEFAQAHGKFEWIEKTPPHVRFIPWLRTHFPNAPIIHLVRDGRDVADSLSRMAWSRLDRDAHLLRWAWRVGRARRQLAGDSGAVSVRYEDLVEAPEETVGHLCQFLGLDYRPAMLLPDGSETGLIETGQDHKELVRQPITRARLARWRETYTQDQLLRAERLIGHELVNWGYPLGTDTAGDRTLILAWPLPRRQHRDALSRGAIGLCDAGHRIVELRCLQEQAPDKLPDAWLTGEPLPLRDGSGLMARLRRLWRLWSRPARWRGVAIHYFSAMAANERKDAGLVERILSRRLARHARRVLVPPGTDVDACAGQLGVPKDSVEQIATPESNCK